MKFSGGLRRQNNEADDDDNDDNNDNNDNKLPPELFAEPDPEPSNTNLPSAEWIKANFKTKSGAIRYLDSQGFKTKDIVGLLRIRYQHVRNVLTKELKRGPSEVFHDKQLWQCSHTKSAFVDVIVRTGMRDPSSDKVLYRVCIGCAVGNIPGVTDEALKRTIPGVKR